MSSKILKLSDRDRRMVCMWLAGKTVVSMMHEFGLNSRGSIIRRAKQIGLPPRMHGKRGAGAPANLFPCIVAWAKRGYTPLEIAVGIGSGKPDLLAAVGATNRHFGSRETKEEFRVRLTKSIKALKRKRKNKLKEYPGSMEAAA